MSYVPRDDRPADKADRYAEVEAEILAVLDGEPNLTARMATVASMLADAFDHFYFFERWAMYTVLARQMGQPVHSLDPKILKDSPSRDKGLTPPAAQAHLNAWMRVLDKEEPDYRN
mgnify:CR=1 FL=1